MQGYTDNIEELTLKNTNFRQVLFTGKHTQFVLMCLKPGKEIGKEIHHNLDQFFRFEKGQGKVIIGEVETSVKDGSAVIVPGGAEHNIINTSSTEDLKLYTLYSPPNHKDGTIHVTKAEADLAEEHYEG